MEVKTKKVIAAALFIIPLRKFSFFYSLKMIIKFFMPVEINAIPYLQVF
jgi:hypothetical protein